MENGLTLANEGNMTTSLITAETSTSCTVLFKLLQVKRISTLWQYLRESLMEVFNGMISSMEYVCQEKAWIDQLVFKHWIVKVEKPFTVKRADKTYLPMD